MTQNKQENNVNRPYWVVINEEQGLAVWPADQELPVGWQRTEKRGTRAECLAFIKLGRGAHPVRKAASAHEPLQ